MNGLSDILRDRVPVASTGLPWPTGTPSTTNVEDAERSLAEADVVRARQDMQQARDMYAQAQQTAPAPASWATAPNAPLPAPVSMPILEPETGTSETFIDGLAQDNPLLAKYLREKRAEQAAASAALAAQRKEQADASARATAEAEAGAQRIIGGMQIDYAREREDMPTRPDVARPGALQLPEPPSVAARPFGSAKPGEPVFESLNRTLAMLGLLGTMGAGLTSNYAQGALAAYSGALAGWAEGDTVRAEREWKDYSHKVNQMKANHASLMEEWNDAWKTYGYDMDTLKVKLGIIAAEHSLDKEQIRLGFTKPEQLSDQLAKTDDAIKQAAKDKDDLEKTLMAEYLRAQERKQAAKERAEDKEQAIQNPPAGGVWYNTKTGDQVGSITAAERRTGDWKGITGKQLETVAAAAPMWAALDVVDKASAALITATTSAEALAQKAALETGAFTKSNAAAALYADTKGGLTAQFSRALGEVGVLTDKDREYAMSLLPKFEDTKEVRDGKIRVLRSFLQAKTGAALGVATGMPVSSLAGASQGSPAGTSTPPAPSAAPSGWGAAKRK